MCRATCATDRPCANGQACDDGFCVASGGPPIELAWDVFPRPNPCAPRASCFYQVHPVDPAVKVTTYSWKFGSEQEEEGSEQIGHVYPATGSYPVSVTARTADGRTGKLVGTENVCGLIGDSCTLTGPACCTGTCSRQIDKCE